MDVFELKECYKYEGKNEMNQLNLGKIYEQLQDDESRRLFEGKINYAISGDKFKLYEKLYESEVKFSGWDFSHLSDDFYKDKKIIIYGVGKYGYHTYFILTHSKCANQIYAFADSNSSKWGTDYLGYNILSPFELLNYKEALVIIASETYGSDIYLQLARSGFPQYNIFFPPYQRLTGGTGHQYFDVFEPRENEVFVDAGCYDGDTSVDFINWCGEKYDRIYAFEPSKDMLELCKNKFNNRGIKNYELIDKATWSEDTEVYFSDDLGSAIFGGAQVLNNSNNKIKTTSIDKVLNGNYVSFIKMDIEGSELEALKGAKESIIKYRPRLAISIYHKREDILEIPSYILGLVPDYNLYIRHYSSDIWETVLYAI